MLTKKWAYHLFSKPSNKRVLRGIEAINSTNTQEMDVSKHPNRMVIFIVRIREGQRNPKALSK